MIDRPAKPSLSTEADYLLQLENTNEFSRRKSRFLKSVAAVVVAVVFVFASGNIIAGGWLAAYIAGLFILVCWNIIETVKLKCPNCNGVPKSYTLDITSPQSITVGINPMAGRCSKCGFYLSRKVLVDDWSNVVHSNGPADQK